MEHRSSDSELAGRLTATSTSFFCLATSTTCAQQDPLQSNGFDCSSNVFCAYHSGDGSISDPNVFYAPYEPYFAIGDPSGCDPGEHPNGRTMPTSRLAAISHEMNEAIDRPRAERAGMTETATRSVDKCASGFGAHLGNTGGQLRLQPSDRTGRYLLQREWSNALNGCYQVGPPTVSLDSTTAGCRNLDRDHGHELLLLATQYAGRQVQRIVSRVGHGQFVDSSHGRGTRSETSPAT